uniref:Uncharacterized protein n=1 Tax=Salix viminalis TaxID=40686 RepID=A0A6N2KBI1_SALVM
MLNDLIVFPISSHKKGVRCLVMWSYSLCDAGRAYHLKTRYPRNLTIQKIMSVQYKIPDYVHVSQACRHLLSRIFVANSSRKSKATHGS